MKRVDEEFGGSNREMVDWLPRFLRSGAARGTQKARSVAGAPINGAKEKASHSGAFDIAQGKREDSQRRAVARRESWKRVS
jgi:hypothetical protein